MYISVIFHIHALRVSACVRNTWSVKRFLVLILSILVVRVLDSQLKGTRFDPPPVSTADLTHLWWSYDNPVCARM